MGHRHGQVDVAHALAADYGAGDFHAAFLADYSVVTDAFVFAAKALEIFGRAENTLAKKSVRLGALRAVVYCLGFCHLASGPAQDVLRAGDAQRPGVK